MMKRMMTQRSALLISTSLSLQFHKIETAQHNIYFTFKKSQRAKKFSVTHALEGVP